MALAVLLGGCGGAAVFALSYKATGVSPMTAYHVGRLFGSLNNNPAIYQTGLHKTEGLIVCGFFGLVTLVLLAVGVSHNWRALGQSWNLVMTVLPVLFYLLVIPHANEIRDFCILGAPFVLLHAGTGLSRMLAWASGPAGSRRTAARVGFAAFVLLYVAPPYISMRDGPRTLTGRLYSPVFWRQWQGRTLGMIAQIRGLVDGVQPGQNVLVISSQFEPDRYLHLRLLQDGFRLQPALQGDGNCGSVETFSRDGRTVVSVRTENPYGMFHGAHTGDYLESMQIADSLHCVAAQLFDRTYFFSVGPSGEAYWPSLLGEDLSIPRHFALPILHRATYGFFRSTPLSPMEVNRLDSAARESEESLRAAAPVGANSSQDFHAHVGTHFWSPAR